MRTPILELFSGEKSSETTHQKFQRHGWKRAEVHAGAAVDHWGDTRVYTHHEHPGHAIHFNTKTGGFKHTVHHSYDLDKHLAKHEKVKLSAASEVAARHYRG